MLVQLNPPRCSCCTVKLANGRHCVVGEHTTCQSGNCKMRFPWWVALFYPPAALSKLKVLEALTYWIFESGEG